VDQEISLFEFFVLQGIDPKAGYIAAAVNEKIIKRSEWPLIFLKNSDRVELIHAVQGG